MKILCKLYIFFFKLTKTGHVFFFFFFLVRQENVSPHDVSGQASSARASSRVPTSQSAGNFPKCE